MPLFVAERIADLEDEVGRLTNRLEWLRQRSRGQRAELREVLTEVAPLKAELGRPVVGPHMMAKINASGP
jgi:hypothetical protein